MKKSNINTAETKKVAGKKSKRAFPIVAIGASAGGLEALEQFFLNTPSKTGMAFVVIQHLDPNHSGMLPELLQRTTSMKVYQVSDSLQVKPDNVYVIPPNASMSVLHDTLHLFEPLMKHGLRLPIDTFFSSLAEDRADGSIGIILSGTGSDGSIGVKSIKEKSGLVIIQDPKEAKFNGMPQNAMSSVEADIVISASKMSLKIIEYLENQSVKKTKPVIDLVKQSDLDKIIILLREYSGHDFSLYKKATMYRRIERRQNLHQLENISSYVRFLQENPQEVEFLFKELLIGVTSFFRDTAVWDMLSDQILPEYLEQLPEGYVVRAWVPACSTGEEAYSLAIVFKETIEKLHQHKNIALQIFATDLDKDAIEIARKGIFPKNISKDVSRKRIRKYFVEEGECYKLNSIIREMVVFAVQNIIQDPPFTKMDILTCRNLLIYIEPHLQKKIIALFNYCLKPEGILLLGSSETITLDNDGFNEIDRKLKIFKRTSEISSEALTDFPSSFFHKRSNISDDIAVRQTGENIQSIANQFLLDNFELASVLINVNGDILYITGRTGKYLEPAAGKANWNIYYMARPGLNQILHSALREARKSKDTIKFKNVSIGNNGGTHLANVSVQFLEKPEQLKDMFMIVFYDVGERKQKGADVSEKDDNKLSNRHQDLMLELQRAYDELQNTREEMQTSQEDLKSINEELQSTNEELQSSNEELTTSKEEMQSLNEELQTVNAELQSKINDYARANDDMINLLNSTEIVTLFLDMKLNIRRFTNNITKIFKLRKSDIGRPFTELVNELDYPALEDHAKSVIDKLVTIENTISTHDDKWFNVRIIPYRTVNNNIDGVVMTFIDITSAKKLEFELKAVNKKHLEKFDTNVGRKRSAESEGNKNDG